MDTSPSSASPLQFLAGLHEIHAQVWQTLNSHLRVSYTHEAYSKPSTRQFAPNSSTFTMDELPDSQLLLLTANGFMIILGFIFLLRHFTALTPTLFALISLFGHSIRANEMLLCLCYASFTVQGFQIARMHHPSCYFSRHHKFLS